MARLRGRHDGAVLRRPPAGAGAPSPRRPPTGTGNDAGNGDTAVPRGVIVLLGMAGAVVAVAGLRSGSDIVGPVLLALGLTVTASPLSTWLRSRGAPAWAATAALIVTVYLILL